MNVLGVCGGMGIILHPFKSQLIANIEPRACFHTKNQEQWVSNFGKIPLYKSNIELNGSVDIIIGAPDCGHSSILSYSRAKQFSKAEDNVSLNTFISAINLYKPKIWLMENLPALLTQMPKKFFRKRFIKYKLKFIICSVSEFGNSQFTRERLFIIGIKRGFTELDLTPYKVREPRSSGELISGLNKDIPELCHVRENLNQVITLYAGYKDNLRNIRDQWLSNGGTRWVVKDRNFSTAPGVYRNLEDKFPYVARKANRQFNHRGEMMTPRELARVQGVPDSFILVYNTKNHNYCINKARITATKCPPYEVGVWFKDLLIKNSII